MFKFVLYSRMYQFIGDVLGIDLLDFQLLFVDYENNLGIDLKFVFKFCIYFVC